MKSPPNVLLVISAKGGIGASIIATTFATILSEEGRAIYIDIDNGHSFTKHDFNQSGNTKLDLIQSDLGSIYKVLDLARPLYNSIVLDVKNFFGTLENNSLINEISLLAKATVLPVSSNEIDLSRTKDFLSYLNLDESTNTIVLDNSYRSRRLPQKAALNQCIPDNYVGRITISKTSFPIISIPIQESTSLQVKKILEDIMS